MTNKKSTKRTLLFSLLAMLLCVTMLVGTTFAWFTDSVTSSGNIIKTGTLQVGMYWAEGQNAVPSDDADWIDAADGAIFDYDNWEPGYAVARHIKIANEGSLALKYQVSIVPTGEVSDLADVIDVYYVDPAVQVAERGELSVAYRLGTLTEVIAGMGASANGVLLADGVDTITLVLKMQETADNNYQDKSIGDAFAVKLVATQYTYEPDSFDNKYDVDVTEANLVFTAAELQEAINTAADGDIIALGCDIVGNVTAIQRPDVDVIVDGMGFEFDGTITIHGQARHDGAETLTIRNIKFVTDDANVYFIDANSTASAERYAHNVTIEGCSFTGDFDDAACRFRQAFNVTIKDCVATGMHSLLQAYGCNGVTVDDVTLDGCKNGVSFGYSTNVSISNSTIDAIGDYSYGIRVDAYVDTTMTVDNCVISADAPVLARKTSAAYTINFADTDLISTADYQVIVSTADYEEGVELSAPTGAYTLNGADNYVVYEG